MARACGLALATLFGTSLADASSKFLVAPSTPEPDVKDYLVSHGLACCVDVLMRESGWLQRGGGIDSIGDVQYLTDPIIGRLPIPSVKKEALMQMARYDRERARRRQSDEQRRGGWLDNWLLHALAALETLLRGFALGFGMSFIYESLVRGFIYDADDEQLVSAMKRAAMRAMALGFAVAVTLHGSAIIVPHAWRSLWLDGSV